MEVVPIQSLTPSPADAPVTAVAENVEKEVVAPVEPAKTEEAEAPKDPAETADIEVAGEDKSTEGDAKKKTAWYMREIGSQREKNQTLKAQNESMAAELQRLQKITEKAVTSTEEGETLPDKRPAGMTQADFDRAVEQAAANNRIIEKYVDSCNEIYNAGVKEFKDFDESVKVLGSVGVLPAQNEPPTPLMQMISRIPEAAKILQHLAQDPEKASELVKMSLIDQSMELAEIRNTLKAPKPGKPISSVPEPINPLNGKSKAEPTLERAKTMEEYVAIRNKDRAASGLQAFVI